MPIKNNTKNTIISDNFKICTSIISKTIGLMFSKKNDISLIFYFRKETMIPIHMLFVFYPIDLLYLDKNKKVIEIKENLKPFSFYNPKNKAMYVIETTVYNIKKTKTTINDQIYF
ncbi:MAG: DUF192 domain-containing protein [Nanoarchaeota archaeon]